MPAPRSQHRDDAVAVGQLVALPVLLVGLWALFVRFDWPALPTALAVSIAVVLGIAGAALVVVSWTSLGGLRAVQALRRWVRNGPEPEAVPLGVRKRFLRRSEHATIGFGRLYLVLAGFWLLMAALDALQHRMSDAAQQIVMVGIWIVVGVTILRFARRWGDRVEQLAAETDAALDGSPAH